MTEPYCLVITNVPSTKPLPCTHSKDPYTLLLDRGNPVEFASVDDAVEGAKVHKAEHPDHEIDIRMYFGRSKYLWEVWEYGQFQISKKSFGRF